MLEFLKVFVAAALVGVLPASVGCRHVGEPAPGVVAVYSNGTVSEAEIIGRPSSAGDPDQWIRDVAWRKISVGMWRAEVEARWDYLLRVAELDHRESAELLLSEVYAQVEVSAEEIDEHLAAVKAMHETPALRIRHIYLRADADSPREVRASKLAAANEVRERALEGESFADLARAFSNSAGASQGGLVDRLRPGMADPSFEKVVFSLSEGEISEVIETPSGFHVVLLEHRYPPLVFDEGPYREAAPGLLRQEEEERLRAELVGRLRASGDFEKRWSARGGVSPRPADGALLEIGGFIFTENDLERVRAREEPWLQRWDLRAAYLDDLLDRELLYGESLRRRMAADAEVRDRWVRATEQALVEGALEREAAEAGRAVPREALEAFAADSVAALDIPETYHTRVIFVADGGSPYDAMTRAEDVMSRIRAGESVAALAEEHSDGPNADRGGDLGYLDSIGLFGYAPELARATSSLEIGATLDPVRITASRLVSTIQALRGGFLIVSLVDRLSPRRLSLDEDEEEVRERFWEQYEAELMAERRDAVLAEAGFRMVEHRGLSTAR